MKKITIGLLVDEVDNNFTNEICRGAKQAADELDVNLITFFGGYLRSQCQDYSYQKNIVFSLAKAQGIDLLIISMGSIVQGGLDIKDKLLHFFGDIPVVTLNTVFEEYSSVTFDNALGLKEALEFLVCDLKKENLAILGGRKGGHDGHIRRKVFRDVLNKYNLLKSENQIIYSNTLDRDAHNDVERLLEQNPNVDAIICFNDEVAIAAYSVLKEHGIKIGKDVSVLGFDDIHEASRLTPSLSSVSAPPYFLGYQAVIKGMKMLEDKQIFHEVLPTRFVMRESITFDYLYYQKFEEEVDDCIVNNNLEGLWKCVRNNLFGKTDIIISKELDKVLKAFIIDVLCVNIYNYESCRVVKKDVYKLVEKELVEYLDIDKLLSLLDMLFFKYIEYHCSSDSELVAYKSFYKDVLKNITLRFDNLVSSLNRKNYESNHLVNLMSRRMMVFNNQKQCYTNILEALKNLEIQNASLLLFEKPLMITDYSELKEDETLELVGYIRNGKGTVLNYSKKTTVSQLLLNSDIQEYTNNLAVTGIYINELFYGILVCDMFLNSYSLLEYLDSHIGSSIYALNLIYILDYQSKTDQLTGLYNRRGILQQIPEFVSEKKNSYSIYVIYVDLDGLKVINDIYGHDEGDLSIKKLGIILKRAFKHESIIGRMGGDEFLVLYASDEGNVEKLIREQLSQKETEVNDEYKQEIDVHMSYGIRKIEDLNQSDFSDEINMADKLMYVCKMNKKTR